MDFVHPEASEFIESLTKAASLLEEGLRDVPKILVHNQTLGLSIHVGNISGSYSEGIDLIVRTVLDPYISTGEMKITRGKDIVEIMPNIDWEKGDAIKKIRQECGGNPLFMFFGDDRSDEEGFADVQDAGGIAVYIGSPREDTKALHQLESPAEVAQVLALLSDLDG